MSIIQNVSQSGSAYIIDGKTLNTPEGVSKPLELKAGSTIQGTVISVTDAEGEKVANISVGDSVISAKLSDEMGLREGQTLKIYRRECTDYPGKTYVHIKEGDRCVFECCLLLK